MKKALSLIIALILALTMALPVFAADKATQLKLDEPTTVSVKADGEIEATFTPEEDGIYVVHLDYDEMISYSLDCNSRYYWDFDEEENFEEVVEIFIGEKGKPCTMTFCGEGSDCSVTVEINELSCGSLTDGTNTVKLGEYGFFTFVPENSGYYNFASKCEEDVYFGIIDADELWAENDDNGYEDDYNFDCTVSLEAGKTYLVEIGIYSENYDNIDCDVIVTYGKTEKVEDFGVYGFYNRCGDTWLMPKNSEEYVWYYFVPSGSAPTADVKIVSGDESLITVEKDEEYNEEVYLVYSGNKAGKTVITVTAGDVTKDIKVKVCNDFEWFFVSLWNIFNNFLARVFHFRFA